MLSFPKSLSNLQGLVRQILKGAISSRSRRRQGKHRHGLRFENLETREMMSATAVGANLDILNDYSAELVFTDAFKQSRDWVSSTYNTATGQSTWGGGPAVQTDANGWPTSLTTWTNSSGQVMQQQLATLMMDSIGGHYPAGTYTAQWSGTGTIAWGNDAKVISTGTNPDGTHFAKLNVTPTNGGISMTITSMSSSDPIKNIHVWIPDYNGQSFVGQDGSAFGTADPFNPVFESQLQPFNTLRFMDWGNTNQNTVVNWADRRQATNAHQNSGGTGVSYEYMIRLANDLHDNVWINVPYAASDDYIKQMADLFRDKLDPNLKVYIEYGNELWNTAGGFYGYPYIQQQMSKTGLDHWAQEAQDFVHTFGIWSQEFAGQTNRMVRVAATQFNNSWATDQILSHMGNNYDVVATAGYVALYNNEQAGYNSGTTVTQVMNDMNNELNSTLNLFTQQQTVLKKYATQLGHSIPMVVYEGGQSLTANSSSAPYLQAFYNAQVSSQMYTLYTNLLNGAANDGVTLFNHYAYVSQNSPYGSWGSLQYQGQPASQAPKYQALLDYINAHPVTNVSLPTFGIQVTTNANEVGSTPGTFTITRSGVTTSAITLNYTVGGTASSSDYMEKLTGTVTFAAGQSTAKITVTPVANLKTNDETVSLTLSQNSSYSLDPNATSATMTIQGAIPDIPGLVATYFADTTLTTQKVTEIDPNINYAWAAGTAPNASLPTTGYSARWTGYLTAPTAGNYLFQSNSDDGIRVYINGQLVINDWSDHYPTLDTTSAIALTAGQVVPITVEYYNNQGAGTAQLLWQQPGQSSFSVIPASQFSNGSSPQFGIVTTTNADENGSKPGTFTITRYGNATLAETVKYTVSGTAKSSDYTPQLNGTVAFAAGQTTATVTITPVANLSTGDETLTLTLTPATGYSVDPNTTSATMTIKGLTTVTAPTFGIVATSNADENGSVPGTFTVTRSGNTTTAATLNYTISGTAKSSDYTPQLTGTVSFAANQTTATITITPVAGLSTSDETLTLALSSNAAYTIDPNAASATMTIKGLTTATSPTFGIVATSNADENGSLPGTFTITRSGNTTTAATLNYTISGTAKSSDYTPQLTGTVSFAANQTTATITITPVAGLSTSDETLTLALSSNAAYTIDPNAASATMTIKGLTSTAASGLAATYFSDMTLTTQKVTETDPNINYAWAAGTAPVAGLPTSQYSARWTGYLTAPTTGNYLFQTNSDDGIRVYINGNLVINDWSDHYPTLDTSAAIALTAGQVVPIKVEYYNDQGAGTAQLLWQQPGQTSFSVIPASQFTTSSTNSSSPQFGIVATANADETGPQAGSFTITRSGNTASAATLNYTVSGTATSADYAEKLSGTVAFAAGQTTATITITPVQDGIADGNETVTITLAPNAAYTLDPSATSATITIKDATLVSGGLQATYFASTNLTNPKTTRTDATINFNWASGTAPVAGLPTTGYSVRWTGYVQAPTTGNYVFQTNSDDGVRLYVNGNLVINNWTDHYPTLNNSAAIALTAGQVVSIKMEYYNNQGAGTAQLLWQQPSQTSFSVISANQLYVANLATFIVNASGNPSEVGPTPGTFTITRSGNTSAPATVNYTVSGTAASNDYLEKLTGSVNFAVGQTTATITITPVQDGQLEGNQTLTISLTPSSNYNLGTSTSATLTIQDGSLVAGGLNATYFSGTNLATAKLTRLDSSINFNWASGTSPGTGVPTSQYSARWTGYVQATTTGNYVFQTNSDDGVRLYVNGALVINNWTDHYPAINNSASIALTAGQVVSITMEYYNNQGAGTAQLLWQQPGQSAFSVIPSTQLYTPTTAPVTYGAEVATLSGASLVPTGAGVVGAGFIQFSNANGGYSQWSVNRPSAGSTTLTIRYANAGASLPLSLAINGVVINPALAFASTGSASTWSTVKISVNLNAGANTIRLTTTGSGGPLVNNIAIG